jgi:hypothetical protein
LHDFYVEVKYNGGINAITKFTSFSTYTRLEPYLYKIDIDFLLNKMNKMSPEEYQAWIKKYSEQDASPK